MNSEEQHGDSQQRRAHPSAGSSGSRHTMFRSWSGPFVPLSHSRRHIQSLPENVLCNIVQFIHVQERARLMLVSKKWWRAVRAACGRQKAIGVSEKAFSIRCQHSFCLTELDVIDSNTADLIMSDQRLGRRFRELFPNLQVIIAPKKALSSDFVSNYCNSLICLNVSSVTVSGGASNRIFPVLSCLSFTGFDSLRLADYPALTSISSVSEMDGRLFSLPRDLTHLSCRLKRLHRLSTVSFANCLTHLYIKTSFNLWDPDAGLLGARYSQLSFPVLKSLVIAERSEQVKADSDLFFDNPPAVVLNQIFPVLSLPQLQSLGLQIKFMTDDCMLALRDLLSRLPDLTALCLSGMYRGLVDEALLVTADTQFKQLRVLFVEPLLLDGRAMAYLSRLPKLRSYGTRIVTYKSAIKIKSEIIAFVKDEVTKRLTDVHFCIEREEDQQLLDTEVKQQVRKLKQGKLEHFRWSSGDFIDSFISEIRRYGF